MKDAETRADQSLEDETKRHLEAYHKLERDCNLEIDLLCNRQACSTLQNRSVCAKVTHSACLWRAQGAAVGRGER